VIALADLERRLADLRGEIAEALGSAAPVELDQTTQGRLSRMDAMQQQAMAGTLPLVYFRGQVSRQRGQSPVRWRSSDGDILERYPDGRERVRFRTVPALETPARMADLVLDWHRCLIDRRVPPLIVLAAFNLDFLCIHPFRDGNGRVSRLLLLLQSYQLGYEVGRYISLERLAEQNKDRYYETLEKSSQGWHEGKHDPWPYINYVLFTLKTAYMEFAERVGETKAPRGAKTDQVISAIEQFAGEFSVAQLELRCPGVSRDMVRRVLREQQAAGKIECQGRGPAAKWRRQSQVKRP
jgi:Fic family protein